MKPELLSQVLARRYLMLGMELTRTPDVGARVFHYVPAEFDPSDLDAVQSLVEELLARPLATVGELCDFVFDWGEVMGRVWAGSSRRLTAMNRDTSKSELKDEYVRYAQEVLPAWAKYNDQLVRRYLASPYRSELGDRFAVLDHRLQADADLYREANTKLTADATAHRARYQEIQGALSIEWDGEKCTRQQIGAHLSEPDRALRERAYRALIASTSSHAEEVDAIYDELIALRTKMADNTGHDSYVEYRFAEMHRFDYTPDDCLAFHAAVDEVVVPELTRLYEDRRRRLGIESLRPWDMNVSVFGGEPQTLFEDQDGLVAILDGILSGVDSVFSKEFDILVRNGLLDVMSRPNKAPGGYNCSVEDIGLPFIFYNAVGRRHDLRVMLHEGGHAFHTIATREERVQAYRHAPVEFCEVASMAMELFGIERLESVLTGAEKRDFTLDQFLGCLTIFPRVARMDAFQIWAYRHPKHSHADRNAKWSELTDRFFPHLDWSGIEDLRQDNWQVTPHLFTHPMYYIEYALAQIGALQLWQVERKDHATAIAGYRSALALGGSQPLPKLFQAAGIRFAMDKAVLREVVPPALERIDAILSATT